MRFIFNIARIIQTYLLFYKHIKGFGVVIKHSKILGNNVFFDNVTVINTEIKGGVAISPQSTVSTSFFEGNNKVGIRTIISETTVGAFTYFSDYGSVNKLVIGKYCSIGANFKVGLGTHPINFLSCSPVFYKQSVFVKTEPDISSYFKEYKQTIVGNDVWVGANVFIVDGIKIGHGAIIAAGAVVTKDVEDYAIIGGVPAKVIRYRYEKDTIHALLQLKWWDKDENWIKKNIHFFQKPINRHLIDKMANGG